MVRAINEGDLDPLSASLADNFVREDRRKLIAFPLRDGPETVRSQADAQEMGFGRLDYELLATRSEQLALFEHTRTRPDDPTGPESKRLERFVYDENVDTARTIVFDIEDLAEAIAEMDRIHNERELRQE